MVIERHHACTWNHPEQIIQMLWQEVESCTDQIALHDSHQLTVTTSLLARLWRACKCLYMHCCSVILHALFVHDYTLIINEVMCDQKLLVSVKGRRRITPPWVGADLRVSCPGANICPWLGEIQDWGRNRQHDSSMDQRCHSIGEWRWSGWKDKAPYCKVGDCKKGNRSSNSNHIIVERPTYISSVIRDLMRAVF